MAISQFILIQSEQNLEQYGCISLLDITENTNFLQTIAGKLFPNISIKTIWTNPNIHKVCDQSIQQLAENSSFDETEIEKLFHNLFPLCGKIALWYGSDYDDLSVFYEQENFLFVLLKNLQQSPYELYIIYKKS